MLKQTVKDYQFSGSIREFSQKVAGTSASPRQLIFDIPLKKTSTAHVLDIGFGTGSLGKMIKNAPQTKNWEIDGIDGYEPNCYNTALVKDRIYRNLWCGLAQDIPVKTLEAYDIICLLDVIEHLPAATAKELIRHLLSNINEDAFLFVSTPLWFYPQGSQQDGDLEEHLIGVPATSMMGLLPVMYAINPPLVGGFVYRKSSLGYVDLFCPVTDREFTYEKGMAVARIINCYSPPGITVRISTNAQTE